MMDFSNKYKSDKIKYKYPKNSLILSDKISLNKDIINHNINNNNHYIVNSAKLYNYYRNNNINHSIKENSLQQNKNKEEYNYINTVKNSTKSRNNQTELSDIYNTADNISNIYTESYLNSIKKTHNAKNNHNSIINNSLNNHIKNFLNKSNNNKTVENIKEKIKNNNYNDNDIKSLNKRKKSLNYNINKKNIFEVIKELEIVNDKKLSKNYLSERENKKCSKMKEILNMKPRVFSQNKKDKEKEKYYKCINEEKNKNKENIIKKIESKKIFEKFNLRHINLNKIKEYFNINTNNDINNNFIDEPKNKKNQGLRKTYTLSRKEQNTKNIKEFGIKSNENKNISNYTNNATYDSINNNYNNYLNLSIPYLSKEKINNKTPYNYSKMNIIYKDANIQYNNNNNKYNNNLDNLSFTNKYNTINMKENISSLIKSDDNLNKIKTKIKKRNIEIYKSPHSRNINISNDFIVSNKKINNENEYNYNENPKIFKTCLENDIKSEEKEKIYDINHIQNYYNYIMNDNLYNSININNKNILNKSTNYFKIQNDNYKYNYSNKESKKRKVFIKDVKLKNISNISKTIEDDINKNNNAQIKKENYNNNTYDDNINQNIYKENNIKDEKKIKTNKEELNKIRKLYKNNNLPKINHLIKKSKEISDKKFKTNKNLPNNTLNTLKLKDKIKKNIIYINKNITENNKTDIVDCNDSEILDINRLDLHINQNDIVYKKINKYNNPKSTSNDIIKMFNDNQSKFESNNIELSKLNESNYSIVSFQKKNNNEEEKVNYIYKDLDLSHLKHVFNSRFNYNIEKKESINLSLLNNKKRNIIFKEEKNNNMNNKEKIQGDYDYNIKKVKKKFKKIKIKKKYKNQIKNKKNNKINIKKNVKKNIEEIQNNEIKKYNSIDYDKNNNQLFYFYINEKNQNSKNNKMNYSDSISNYPYNQNSNNKIYGNKISINKKLLTNRNIVPNLYNNLYKYNKNNINDLYNISNTDNSYKFSDSYNISNNNNYIKINKYNNNYLPNFSNINNNLELNSFRHGKNKSFNYFTCDFNNYNNANFNNYLNNYNNINKKSLNLNNYNLNKNKIIKYKMEENLNKNTKNNASDNNDEKNDLEEEEVEIEESEEENDEEEEAQSPSREEKSNTNTTSNINKIIPKEKYLLELKENGLPDLPKNKILSCNVGSLINISIYNGLPISSNISLITDSYQMFPTSDFIENIIKENKNNDNNKKYLNNEYFEKKVNSFQKYPSIINTKIFFQIITERAGNITFLFMYKDENDNNKLKFTEPFYILVNPLIDLNKNNNNNNENENNKNIIELTQIKMQTVISKSIGKLKNDFENYYEEASLLGYNFIHFKTLQSLSSSENLYSIKDHNELNDIFFMEQYKNNYIALQQEKKNEIFQNEIKKLKQKYSIGGITDIILTQASTESEWILNHTECAYNLENSPWLNVAYKLDEILVNYSNNFYNKKVSCSCAPYINNIKDLEETMEEIGNEVYKNNLEEYFLIPINEYIDKFKIFYNNYLLNQDKEDYIIKKNLFINEIKKEYFLRESNYNKNMNMNINNDEERNSNELLMNEKIIYDIISQSCKKYGYKRYGVEMSIELISLLIIEKYRIKSRKNELINNYEFLQEIKNYINKINKEWSEKSKEMIKIALLNIKEFIRYQFIQLNRIGIKRQLIDNYFYVIDKNNPKKILLCNGWIMQSEDNSNYYPDTTAYGTWYYFKRKVIIWKDTIKINYGENISKTPQFLLNYMTKYITFLSNIFEGLYIESLANLPIFILKYFIYKARQINPNIIFMTQLPIIDDEIDDENINNKNEKEDINNHNNIQKNLEKKYSEELGINLFVHEIIWDCSNNELVKNILSNVNSNSNMTEGKIISKFNSNLYSMSKRSDNNIIFGSYKYLKYHKPFCILYDLTQDNQSYYEKYNILSIQNAMMASIGMLDCAIGSTRGFDQLFPFQVSSQKEQRLYYFENYKIKNLIKTTINIKENDPEKQFEEVIFEFNTNNILINDINKKNNLDININDIKNVKLALSFHKWKPDITLEKINKNLFMTKIKLPTGKHYYKYVIDGNLWVCDSTKPVEVDENKNMNNLLDLNVINSVPISDITLLRCYINCIREKFYNKKSEIFLQKNNDLLCVIRMITDSKSLINNNIEDDIINEYKNNLKFKPSYHILKNDNGNMINNKVNANNDINYNNNYDNINVIKNINYEYNKLINGELNNYEGYAIITRPTYNIIDDGGKGEIIIPGKIDSVIASFSSNKEEDYEMNNILDNKYLLGINSNMFFNKDNDYLKHISTINYYKDKTIIRFHSFPPNSILILKFSLDNEILNIIEDLSKSIELLFNKGDKFVDKYDLSDINKILYQTENEEREWSFNKRGTYELNIIDEKILNNENKSKNKIKFIYSGIHQIMDIIKKIKRKEKQNILFNDNINNNDNGITSFMDDKKFINSLYYDIAENDYLIDYAIERINNINSFALMNDYIKNNILSNYKLLPNHLKPIFFESIIISLYQNIIRISLQNIPFSLLNFGDFATALSLCRYEFFGQITSSSSFILDLSKNPDNLIQNIAISKGIPNNTIGSERMYFRDTLIGFKSLFLISNSYNEGKNILKIIASSLRHGLIPDFFDEGEKPRYNSRDTCWLFINAIKNYIYYTKDYNFLKEEIELIFTSDISFNEHLQKKIKGEIKKYSLESIIHIIFQSHAKGIHFREWDYSNKNYFNNNYYTKKEGYNIDIELEPNTGFIYGGNYCNNGTWMNKLGTSGKNKGTPATPRPGADIEIIALVYSCLDFIVDMGNKNYFKYKSVELSNGMNYPYSQWKLLIKDSFEDEFFVKKYNTDINNNNYNNNDFNNNLIKGNIYKDYKNKNNVNIYEFQLRPNFLIALYIAPELFTYKNIINSLNNVESYLLRNENNVIGLKTLDKTDKEYNGLYNNKENNNFYTSGGFNIHNGIEHTWLYGLYLILKIKYFYNENKNKETPYGNEDENQKIIKFISNKLIPIMNIIKNNKWFGLPEMTDELGNIIKDGNQSDLKAMSIFLELIDILSKLDLENENEYSNEYIDNSNIET